MSRSSTPTAVQVVADESETVMDSIESKNDIISTHKQENQVDLESGEECSSEEDDEQDDDQSEADREIRKQHAEEIEKYIEIERANLTRLFTEFPQDTKLTRKKAREWDHGIINFLKLGGVNSEENSSVLEEDFDDEEEDDEYEPNDDDDDDQSDEFSTTCSDIDSQPATPAENLIQEEAQSTAKYDEEGVFKIPGEPPKTPGRYNQEENIARRTRSHISLTTTPIETIEEDFIPPDFSADLDDTDMDPDESWQEFLKQFQKPLNSLNEEEEETDPEYVAPGREAGDVDEVEDIPITKDEVHGLLDELLDGFQTGFEYVENDFADTVSVNPTRADPNNPFDVTTSHVQPVAIIHTNPPLAPKYEMVLGADDKMYVLTRSNLRDLVPGVSFRRNRNPVTTPFITVDITGDTEDIVEEIRDHMEAYEEFVAIERREWFSEIQLRRLQIQLMKHVQLMGQFFIQSYGHPELHSTADFYMKKLRNLVHRSRKSPSLRHLCWNLRDMYDRCEKWQTELSVDNETNQEYAQWLAENKQYHKFHPRVMECMVTCKALVFSELFPRYRVNKRKNVIIGPKELQLIVWSFKRLRDQTPDMSISASATAFIKHYAPWRDWGTIMGWFRRERGGIAWKFKETGEAPEVVPETMTLTSYSQVMEPAQRAKGTLPSLWNTYIFSKERIRRVYRDIVQPLKADKVKSEVPPRLKSRPSRLQATEQEPVVTIEYQNFKAEFNFPAQIAPSLPPSGSQRLKPVAKGGAAVNKRKHGGARTLSRQQTLKLIQSLVNPERRRCKSLDAIRTRKRLTLKLYTILEVFHDGYGKLRTSNLNENSISVKIFNFLKEFDIFARLFSVSMRDALLSPAAAAEGSKKDDTVVAAPTPKRAKLDDEAVIARRAIELNRKYQRAQRMHDNNRLLLQPESVAVGKERDSTLVWNFFHQVTETYKSEGRPEKNQEFISILKSFKPKDGVPILFNKMEKFFLPEHRELLDTFLMCLMPGHAAQIGRFFEHYMLTNMYTLMSKLRIYYEKQPNQWKKIVHVLSEVMEQGATMAIIRQRFLPLMKGNPLLIDWFMQLFPTERPPEALDNEFEEIQTKNDLPFEEIPASVILADSSEGAANATSCPIKYMQGRIQYGNRYILPADLSFLATSYELTGGKEKNSGRVEKVQPAARGKGKRNAGQKNDGETSPSKPVGCIHAVGPLWEDSTAEELSGGGQSASNSSGMGKEELLCDVTTLRAHMNRLNPPLVVEPTGSSTGAGGSGAATQPSEEAKISPKKAHEWKTIPITARSRAGSRPQSPKKGSPKKGTEAGNKRKRQTTTASASASVKTDSSGAGGAASESGNSIDWTREEDKIILDAVNGQEGKTEEQILDQLSVAIPDRSRSDIANRFQFIINVLKQFA